MIDLGGGIAVAFKAESHNHPSAVEPFQGAATGVGGILRDIIAMGARPIRALLDGVSGFGAPDRHFRRAVAGIGHYGNCVGVPNVGGECAFDEAYTAVANPARERDVRRAPPPPSACSLPKPRASATRSFSTERSPAATASVACRCSPLRTFLEGSDEKRPSVQIGDPFRGKALIEVSLESSWSASFVCSCSRTRGAAGLASSLSEMARDGHGASTCASTASWCARATWSRGRSARSPSRRNGWSRSSRPSRSMRCVPCARVLGASRCTVIGEATRSPRAARLRRRRDRRLDPGCVSHRRVLMRYDVERTSRPVRAGRRRPGQRCA